MLSYILAFITLLAYAYTIHTNYSVQTYVLFVLYMLPLMDLKVLPEAYGGFKTFDLISFYTFILLFKRFITVSSNSKNSFYFLLFLLLTIITVLGCLNSEFQQNSLINILKLFPIFIFSRFLISECFNNPLFYVKIIDVLKLSFSVCLIFLVIQVFVGLNFTFYSSLSGNTSGDGFVVRYPGVFYDSQAHGQFLAMGAFLFLFIKDGVKKSEALLNYSIFVSSIMALILAGSRSALGGFGLGLIVMFLLADNKIRMYGMVLIIVGALAYIVISPQSGAFSRAENLNEDYLFRQSIWKEAFEIAKIHPYLGIGIERYQRYIKKYNQDQYIEVEGGELIYFDQPENGYLKILVELGFIGFGIFCIFLLLPLLGALKRALEYNSDKRITFLMASIISWLVAFNTVYTLYDYRIFIIIATILVLIILYSKHLNKANA